MTDPLGDEVDLPPAGAAAVEARFRLPGWAGQVGRFLVVGGLAFLADAGVLWLMLRAGVGPYAGRVASMSAGMVLTYWLNRLVTFRTAAAPSWREFAIYVVNSLTGAAINYTIFSAMVAFGAPPVAGLIVGTGLAAVFNFFRYRAILG